MATEMTRNKELISDGLTPMQFFTHNIHSYEVTLVNAYSDPLVGGGNPNFLRIRVGGNREIRRIRTSNLPTPQVVINERSLRCTLIIGETSCSTPVQTYHMGTHCVCGNGGQIQRCSNPNPVKLLNPKSRSGCLKKVKSNPNSIL